MAIIARPIKSSGGTDFVAGFTVLAAEVNADLNTIFSDYNGNITSANLASNAGVLGTQVATKPNGMASANINADAVTSVELQDDPAIDGNRAVTSDHIRNLAILFRHVKTANWDTTPGGNVPAGGIITGPTGLTNLTAIPLMWETIRNGTPISNERLSVNLHRNSSDNQYHIVIGNMDSTIISLTGLSFRLIYIPIS